MARRAVEAVETGHVSSICYIGTGVKGDKHYEARDPFYFFVNIWNEAKIKFTDEGGQVSYQVISFTGSCYKSRKLWINNGPNHDGQPDNYSTQGTINALWDADPQNPTFVDP